jgi:hypothetical protein
VIDLFDQGSLRWQNLLTLLLSSYASLFFINGSDKRLKIHEFLFNPILDVLEWIAHVQWQLIHFKLQIRLACSWYHPCWCQPWSGVRLLQFWFFVGLFVISNEISKLLVTFYNWVFEWHHIYRQFLEGFEMLYCFLLLFHKLFEVLIMFSHLLKTNLWQIVVYRNLNFIVP